MRAPTTLTLFTLAALPFAVSPANAALEAGSAAPNFTTKAAMAGKTFDFSLAKQLKKGPVVLYFFPAAFTPGCTVEANQFAEATPEFRKLGATVVGMSADPVETLAKFSTSECRSKFAVASASPTVINAYDVKLAFTGKSDRTSYLVSPGGKVIAAWSALDYREHVPKMMTALKAWRAAGQKAR
jgi:peroxiredoxin